MKLSLWLSVAAFIISFSCSNPGNEKMEAVKENGKLILKSGEAELLSYQFETMYPPEGVDSVFKRSGFIHPLKTPSGKVLTRVQPEDHYHHYGIWNPWTHTLFEDDTLDFWNLYKHEGTVRFAGFEDIIENEEVAGYRVMHEHIVLKNGAGRVALQEVQTVRASKPENGHYTLDFKFEYTPATKSKFKILEYRYGGFGWRSTGEWDNQNSMVLTSEGETRKTADGSLARWVIIQGTLGEGYGGALIMGNPENINHPEPIRVWPEDQYERGDMFICMFPTKFADWEMEPGNTYTLKYRMIVFDGQFTKEMAEKEWNEYTSN